MRAPHRYGLALMLWMTYGRVVLSGGETDDPAGKALAMAMMVFMTIGSIMLVSGGRYDDDSD